MKTPKFKVNEYVVDYSLITNCPLLRQIDGVYENEKGIFYTAGGSTELISEEEIEKLIIKKLS